ncbi:hypothetical protein [Halococcus saccharolyticus]|uniref:hypothetical protein n=1 Tax=Halococcus saccharolyticus TaxID=62319 RepID=UPI0012676022|nr:hypothetical protein [Halococcus saccharolyticus]
MSLLIEQVEGGETDCDLCGSAVDVGVSTTSYICLARYRRGTGIEERLTNHVLGDDCSEELAELRESIDSIRPPRIIKEAVWDADSCGFCGDEIANDVRWGLEMFTSPDGGGNFDHPTAFCEACSGVFVEFLRDVRGDGR